MKKLSVILGVVMLSFINFAYCQTRQELNAIKEADSLVNEAKRQELEELIKQKMYEKYITGLIKLYKDGDSIIINHNDSIREVMRVDYVRCVNCKKGSLRCGQFSYKLNDLHLYRTTHNIYLNDKLFIVKDSIYRRDLKYIKFNLISTYRKNKFGNDTISENETYTNDIYNQLKESSLSISKNNEIVTITRVVTPAKSISGLGYYTLEYTYSNSNKREREYYEGYTIKDKFFYENDVIVKRYEYCSRGKVETIYIYKNGGFFAKIDVAK